jgi:hypothetical protein
VPTQASDLARVRARGIAAHVRTGAAVFACQVEDVSRAGAFLRSDQRLEVGAQVDLDLVKPGGRKALHLRGRVEHVVDGGAGRHPGIDVRFLSVGGDDQRRLATWIEELRLLDTASVKTPLEVTPVAVPEAVAATEGDAPHAARMMLQIKGLLLEMDDLRDQMRLRDVEVEELRRQLATAEQLLGRRS